MQKDTTSASDDSFVSSMCKRGNQEASGRNVLIQWIWTIDDTFILPMLRCPLWLMRFGEPCLPAPVIGRPSSSQWSAMNLIDSQQEHKVILVFFLEVRMTFFCYHSHPTTLHRVVCVLTYLANSWNLQVEQWKCRCGGSSKAFCRAEGTIWWSVSWQHFLSQLDSWVSWGMVTLGPLEWLGGLLLLCTWKAMFEEVSLQLHSRTVSDVWGLQQA